MKEKLASMANALFEMQKSLEPIRDKALDQKAFFNGYATCAEGMIKLIVEQAEKYRKQSEEIQTEQNVEQKVEQKVEQVQETLKVEVEQEQAEQPKRKKKVQ